MKNSSFCAAAAALYLLCGAAPGAMADQRPYSPFLTRGDTSFTGSFGVRKNDFDWNIASDLSGAGTPNVLSELTWKDVYVLEGKAKLRHERPVYVPYLTGALVLEGQAKVGMTVAGDNQDSDYNGDNRTDEFSRSNNSADAGYTAGTSAAIGYRLDVTPASVWRKHPDTYWSVTPLAGYGWDRQLYKMSDGNQTIPDTGAFGGLESEYMADWFGPFLGMETEWQKARHLVRLRGEYHWYDYRGKGTWNLRDDFSQDPSFRHSADGDGFRLESEYAYALSSSSVVSAVGAYEERSAKDGYDTTYFRDGGEPTIRLNEVNDESAELHLGLRYHW